MTNPVNDIFLQASQGSVAAIIQVLNDRLSDCGVRTRAIFENGVLQLLCEAATPEQLDITTLPERVRKILEAIAPRNIRRVNINSRIVREQQLLWLQEIRRDPDGQLLWSKEITLNQPNLLQQVAQDLKSLKTAPTSTAIKSESPRQQKARKQLLRGGLLGASTVTLLGLVAWAAYTQFAPKDLAETQPTFSSQTQPQPKEKAQPVLPKPSPMVAPTPMVAPSAIKSVQPSPTKAAQPTRGSADSFAKAVRLAEQAATMGRKADSAATWLEIAARWRQASDLMAAVPATDKRYATAQDRVATYLQNSEAALQNAQK
ncbi:MAG TPA: hypothetical protein IGS53_13190 [Leptolyngbyaceae cyanobacterium M33_DOE_097]|uniref:Uncharacterized protein n=1 Tax=Oscillatoriales cyanobacterium SpSt-418 TaxID=2282169 RepID=A0A7C3PEV0_9CYAN|nr:hypothetical protein [Leptolyngbyaceae cyanobacterium M33_DOE_097]